jgi:flagellar M-ring protein FliF
VLGPGNSRAQVSAELDFSEIEQASETYKPNQKPDEAAVRTSQTSEQTGPNGGAQAQGVPGALTNQPPNTGGAPINQDPNKPADGTQTASASANQTSRKEAAVSYEVDKTIRHTKVAQGTIKRLSVAVVLNDRKVTDAKGKVTNQPLSDQEKQQITELVKGVVGYDKDRGDVVSVVNSAFTTPEAEKQPELPMWKDPEYIALAKEGGKWLGMALIVLFVLRRLKPVMKNLARVPEPPAPPVELLPSPEPIEPQPEAAPPARLDRYQTTVESARQIAKQDPKIVADVVKGWVTNGS